MTETLTATSEALTGEVVRRFWSYVDADGDCWEWMGGRSSTGYGMFHIPATRNVPHRKAHVHRLVLEILAGPVAPGHHVDHLCRNRGCLNPDHLEVVPPGVNFRRGFSPGAIAVKYDRCPQGHDLNDAYVANRATGVVTRNCRKCRHIRLGLDVDSIPRKLRTHCKQGHPYPIEGRRRCKECANAAKRRWAVKQASKTTTGGES